MPGGMVMTGFYMTYARSRPDWIPPIAAGEKDVAIAGDGSIELVDSDHEPIPLLTNATHRWTDAQEAFLDPFEYETRRSFDSGGYNVQARFADRNGELEDDVTQGDVGDELATEVPFYPWSVEDYHRWLCQHADSFEWAAVMDYACEERFDCLWSAQDRVDATVKNTIRHFDRHSGEYGLLPVLQGRTLEDYLDCYDRLDEAGIPLERVGLGTVCRLSSSEAIVDLEQQLRERREFESIHGFGVKVDSFSRGAGFETADSQAWIWDASHGNEVRYVGGSLDKVSCDNSLRRTVVSFREYYRHVAQLRTGEDPLPPLFEPTGTTQATLRESVLPDGGEPE